MLQQIVEQLKTRNLMRVSLETGVSLVTLQNLVAGRNTNPTWRTLEALEKYLNGGQNNEFSGESKKA